MRTPWIIEGTRRVHRVHPDCWIDQKDGEWIAYFRGKRSMAFDQVNQAWEHLARRIAAERSKRLATGPLPMEKKAIAKAARRSRSEPAPF